MHLSKVSQGQVIRSNLARNAEIDRRGCPYRVVGHVHRLESAEEVDIEHEAVVGPRAELHVAGLLVVREVQNVDVTRALQYRHRDPQNVAIAADDGQRIAVFL